VCVVVVVVCVANVRGSAWPNTVVPCVVHSRWVDVDGRMDLLNYATWPVRLRGWPGRPHVTVE